MMALSAGERTPTTIGCNRWPPANHNDERRLGLSLVHLHWQIGCLLHEQSQVCVAVHVAEPEFVPQLREQFWATRGAVDMFFLGASCSVSFAMVIDVSPAKLVLGDIDPPKRKATRSVKAIANLRI
jgi:hypothetical protein